MLQLQYRQNHHADAIQTANAVQRQQFISQALKTRTWNLSKRARAELQDGDLTWRGSTTQDQHFLRATYRNKLRINVISGTIDTVVARCPLPGRSIHTGHRHHLVTSGPERTVSDRSGRERRFLRNHCTLIFSPWIGAKRHEQHTARRHQSYF